MASEAGLASKSDSAMREMLWKSCGSVSSTVGVVGAEIGTRSIAYRKIARKDYPAPLPRSQLSQHRRPQVSSMILVEQSHSFLCIHTP